MCFFTGSQYEYEEVMQQDHGMQSHPANEGCRNIFNAMLKGKGKGKGKGNPMPSRVFSPYHQQQQRTSTRTSTSSSAAAAAGPSDTSSENTQTGIFKNLCYLDLSTLSECSCGAYIIPEAHYCMGCGKALNSSLWV